MKSLILALVAVFLLSCGIADASLRINRVSNKDAASAEPDGLEPGGDRQNSYAWAMDVMTQGEDDYLYVGMNRNLVYNVLVGFLHLQTDLDPMEFNETIDALFQGDILTPDDAFPFFRAPDRRGRIFRYNLDGTGGWEPVYRGNYAFRGAQTYTDDDDNTALYMVTTGEPGRVLKFPDTFDPETDEPVEVLRLDIAGIGQEGPMRAITIYGDYLVVGTFGREVYITDLPQEQEEGTDTATLGWERIAEGITAFPGDPDFDPGTFERATGALWQLLSFNDYLYAFFAGGGTTGFSVYKGEAGTSGWDWQEIVGRSLDTLPPGMGDLYSNATATGVFKDHVYVGSMTETHLSLMTGGFSTDRIQGAQLYRFDKEDNWELVIGNPERTTAFDTRIGNYGAGFYRKTAEQSFWEAISGEELPEITFNQYIWWMEEHEGRFYLTTFDLRVFLRYITEDLLEEFGLSEEQIDRVMDALELIDIATDNPAGFDLYRSSDGINWSPVTRDGFGDPYNYGGRVLKSTDEGLFVGTANPFYGGQVWSLEEKDKSSSSSGSNCFIATAAYGTPMAGEVDALRALRDEKLLASDAGRSAVNAYYTISPPVARLIEQNKTARAIVRGGLRPLVSISRHLVEK